MCTSQIIELALDVFELHHWNILTFRKVFTVLRQGYPCTYSYDEDGNETLFVGKTEFSFPGTVTMSYDKENRMVKIVDIGGVTTYTYSGDGLKRSEEDGDGLVTLVWDGSEYLEERK